MPRQLRVLPASFSEYAASRLQQGARSESMSSPSPLGSRATSSLSTPRGQTCSTSTALTLRGSSSTSSSTSLPRRPSSTSSKSSLVSTMPVEAVIIASNSISNITRKKYDILFDKFVNYGSKLGQNVTDFSFTSVLVIGFLFINLYFERFN